jgi:hypothetical protein
MLLAERNNEYIDLRINNDKPYYRLDTAATLQATANNSSVPQPQASSHASVTRQGSFLLSQFATKEPSPNPLPTPELSPSRKSQTSGCGGVASESDQFSPGRKPGMSLATSSYSVGAHSYGGGDRQASGDSERRGLERRDRMAPHENGRPSSVLLPQERERREKQKQNPYVDEPSRAAATTLALPNSNGIHTRIESDGAIEMSHLGRSSNSVSRGECPEIQITGED